MIVEHICMVCFQPSWEHDEDAGWPPLCCHGCPCGMDRPEESGPVARNRDEHDKPDTP